MKFHKRNLRTGSEALNLMVKGSFREVKDDELREAIFHLSTAIATNLFRHLLAVLAVPGSQIAVRNSSTWASQFFPRDEDLPPNRMIDLPVMTRCPLRLPSGSVRARNVQRAIPRDEDFYL